MSEMSSGRAAALVAIAFAAGLALRLARLDARPMHHDEANQAVKFGALLESGEYRYDAHDHHGPTLYYLSLPAARLRGQVTFASLDERTLRGVTAAFGAATILLLPLLAPAIGSAAVTASAWLLAVSPAMVFYSRMFIQESLFAFFTLVFVIAVGRLATRPSRPQVVGRFGEAGSGIAWSALAGLAAGLAIATKETSVIVLPTALASCAIVVWSLRTAPQPDRAAGRRWAAAVLVSMAVAVMVAALFYSSFLASPGAILDPFRAAGTYFDRGVDPADHAHPWHFYFGLLTYFSSGGLRWSEAIILALALAGAVMTWRHERMFWPRYLVCNAIIAATIFSVIPYKTPWNLLPFYVLTIVVAGIGFSKLISASSSRVLRAAVVAAFVAGLAHLGWQAWRASITYASDPRNPYVYAQTVPDAVRMATRIRQLAALHADGDRMLVAVIASPHEQWPLPWYLRTLPHVGYWTAPGDALAMQAPVVVSSADNAAAVDSALGDRYVSEFYGLRPEVLLTLYIERGLWDRFLAAQTPPVALWRATSAP